MAKLIIEVETLDQAKELAHWYEGQGEQDADVWFECNDVKTPISKTNHPGGCIQVDEENETVILYCI